MQKRAVKPVLISRVFRKVRPEIVGLLLVALISNAIFPLAANAIGSSSPNKVLLCTSKGYQWVQIGSEAEPPENNSHCVLCLNPDDDSDFIVHAQHSISDWTGNRHSLFSTRAGLSSSASGLPFARAPPALL